MKPLTYLYFLLCVFIAFLAFGCSAAEETTDEGDAKLENAEVGEHVVLNNIYFDFGKATLRDESKPELERIIRVMKKNPTMRIEISGHTDNVGTDAVNNRLSQDRANSVVRYLTQVGSIRVGRLAAKGYGKTRPVATNDTEEGRQQNRRIEFTVLEK